MITVIICPYGWTVVINQCVLSILCCVAANVIILWTRLLHVENRRLSDDVLNVPSIWRDLNAWQLYTWVPGRWPLNVWLAKSIKIKFHSTLTEDIWHLVKSSVANVDLILAPVRG